MANLLYPATTGHITDDRFSALVEPNLFAGDVFRPGVTFTDKYQTGPAGQIMVHKPGIGTVSPTIPGADFSDELVQDDLVTISLDKQFDRSRKLYAATEASVAYPMIEVEMEMALKEIRTAWNFEAMKEILQTVGILVDDNYTSATATNGSDIYDTIINTRRKLRLAKANPNVLIVSPATYAKLLKAPEFQRSTSISDSVITNGAVGKVAGLWVYEYESLNDAAKAATATIGGVEWSDTGDELEYVMYDRDAFSIVTSVEAMRTVDEPTRFAGTLAQVQIVSGFKVTNPSRAAIKMFTTSTVAITFNMNGGNVGGVTDDVVTNLVEGTLVADGDPTAVRSGYMFSGWAYAANGVGGLAIRVGEVADTFYAQWTAVYTVTYDLNGGNIGGSEADVVVTGVPSGELVGSAYTGGTPVFTANTWTTPYWVTTAEGSTDAASLPVTANVTVYAYWVAD